MKKIKVLVLVGLFFGLFQGNLFPIIYSRVEGIVTDDLGQPVKGADVALFEVENETPLIKRQVIIRKFAKTGDNGFFRIDDVESGSYFLSIMKEGYAVFGPIHAFQFDLIGDLDQDALDWQKINSFYLKEGQIKHFKIQLEKEAILKINILKKTPQGTEPANKFVSLYPITIKHAGYANYIEDSFRNELTVPYYKEGNVTVEISYQGEMKKHYEIALEKGKTFVLDHVFDFTVGQVVHGVVKDKLTGDIVFGASVDLAKLNDPDNKYFFSTISEEEFWIGGIKPGLYKLYVSYLFNPNEPNERDGQYSITFSIENNDKKVFNIEL